MILKNTGQQRKHEQGFTLVELLVAMAMVGIVVAASYSTYKSQQDSYVAQEQVAEMQQNLRASLYQMAKAIRMAGFNPQRAPDIKGFMEPGELQGDPGTETKTTDESLALAIDQDQNGFINPDDHTEQIAYKFNNTDKTLEKLMYDTTDSTWKWQTVAENIDEVNFVYLDGDGTPIDPTTDANLPFIRSIEISLIARTSKVDRSFPGTLAYDNKQGTEILAAQPDNRRRRLLTTTILCRNMGT